MGAPSKLEQRVARLEQAFRDHFKIDLDEHDADAEAARERGAEIEAAAVEAGARPTDE